MPVHTSRPTQQEREQDRAIRLQYAEQRRAGDQALRQPPARCTRIAEDTAVLLNAILGQTEANTTEIFPCEQQEQAENLRVIAIITHGREEAASYAGSSSLRGQTS